MRKLSEASAVLFDLDGTLTDPKEGITKSVAYALGKYGVAVSDRRTLYRFIGPPLAESFERFYGFSPAQAKEAVAYYREYFQDKGIFENAVYSGVRALLAALRGEQKTLVMATSKPEVYAERIAVHFGIDRYFDCIAVPPPGRRRKAGKIPFTLPCICGKISANAGYRFRRG